MPVCAQCDDRGLPYTGSCSWRRPDERARRCARRPPRLGRAADQRPPGARTWLFVALPLLLAAFTVGRPQPLPAPTLPAAFDASTAEQLARELARDYPDRSPGSAGSLGAADWVSEQLTPLRLRAAAGPLPGEFPGRGRVQLQNIVAVARGDRSARS